MNIDEFVYKVNVLYGMEVFYAAGERSVIYHKSMYPEGNVPHYMQRRIIYAGKVVITEQPPTADPAIVDLNELLKVYDTLDLNVNFWSLWQIIDYFYHNGTRHSNLRRL